MNIIKWVQAKVILTCCLLWGIQGVISSQEAFRIMFYNVENLFDCRHDSLKNDYEFLPTGVNRWTPKRFNDKLTKIAKVIVASGDKQVPDLVGLCEVENEYCLTALTQYSPLREAGYRYVMTNSSDHRGIDVALLYQRATFKLLSNQSIRVPNEEIGRTPTRDILHVTGQLLSGDTLDLFVCHFPSRSGGEVASEPFRLLAALTLRQTIDSVMAIRLQPSVVIMGDFNDYPTNRSLKETLHARSTTEIIEPHGLYNLMYGRKGGTYRYKGEWGMLDQFIVSGTLLLPKSSSVNLLVEEPSRIRTTYNNAQVLRHPFLLEEDNVYGGDTPYRTYKGRKYHGGFSDHLPIILDLEYY
ncbi:MAG: endonuclease/exonuclease/phosphatase family protein [Phocaeicola sp.]